MRAACGDGGVLACGRVGFAVRVPAPAGDGVVGGDGARMLAACCDGGVLACGRVGLACSVPAPAGDGFVGSDGTRIPIACCDGGVSPCGVWLGCFASLGLAVGAAVGDKLGVDVEPAAVGVEEGFLALDQCVSDFEVVLGGAWGRGTGGDGVGVGASAGDNIGVGAEQAAVGVQQVLLVGDELVAHRDVFSGNPDLGRHRRLNCDNRAEGHDEAGNHSRTPRSHGGLP